MAEDNEHLLTYLLVICILFWEISTELLSSHIFLDFFLVCYHCSEMWFTQMLSKDIKYLICSI